MVLAKEPTKQRTVTIQQREVNAEECFTRSYKLLYEIGPAVLDELLHTLRHWASYERLRDDTERADALMLEVERVQLQMTPVPPGTSNE